VNQDEYITVGWTVLYVLICISQNARTLYAAIA